MRRGVWVTGAAGSGEGEQKQLFARPRLAQKLDLLLYVNGVRELSLAGARGPWGSAPTRMDLRPLLRLKNLRKLSMELVEVDFGTPRMLFQGQQLERVGGSEGLEECTLTRCRLPLSEVARPQRAVGTTFLANADVRRFVGSRTRKMRLESCRIRGIDLSGCEAVEALGWLEVEEREGPALQFLDVSGTGLRQVGQIATFLAKTARIGAPLFVDCSATRVDWGAALPALPDLDTLILRGTPLRTLSGLADVSPRLQVLDCAWCAEMNELNVGESGSSLPQLRVLLAESSKFSTIRPEGAFPGLQFVDSTDAEYSGSSAFFKRPGLFHVETGKTLSAEEVQNRNAANQQIPEDQAAQPGNAQFRLFQNEPFNARRGQALGDRLGLLLQQNAQGWEILQEFDAPSVRRGPPRTFFELRERWKVARFLFDLWSRGRAALIRKIIADDEFCWVNEDLTMLRAVDAGMNTHIALLETVMSNMEYKNEAFQ